MHTNPSFSYSFTSHSAMEKVRKVWTSQPSFADWESDSSQVLFILNNNLWPSDSYFDSWTLALCDFVFLCVPIISVFSTLLLLLVRFLLMLQFPDFDGLVKEYEKASYSYLLFKFLPCLTAAILMLCRNVSWSTDNLIAFSPPKSVYCGASSATTSSRAASLSQAHVLTSYLNFPVFPLSDS